MLLTVLDAMGNRARDRRDRAILLLGFIGALKRTELVNIDVCDLTFKPDGLSVKLRGRTLVVPTTNGELCAPSAVKGWIQHAALDLEPSPGPLFRRFDRGGDPTPHRLDSAFVSVIVKSRLQAVGIDPEPYSAQSLRRGRFAELARGVL
jgi:integrase